MRNNNFSVLISLVIHSASGLLGNSQGFLNLNFESAQIVLDQSNSYYPYAANAALALPGWTSFGGAPGGADIFYNDVSLGSAAVSIHDTSDAFGFPPLQGNYSVLLQGSQGGTPTSVAIAQTGQIPGSSGKFLSRE
jgi:hypothetical protein